MGSFGKLATDMDELDSVEGLDWLSGDNCSSAQSIDNSISSGVSTVPLFSASDIDHPPTENNVSGSREKSWNIQGATNTSVNQNPLPADAHMRQIDGIDSTSDVESISWMERCDILLLTACHTYTNSYRALITPPSLPEHLLTHPCDYWAQDV